MKRIACLVTLLCLLASLLPAFEYRAQAEPKYYITVDITNQIVTVYDNGNTADSGIVRQMICSTGKDATPTPTGTYKLPSRWNSMERSEWFYFSEFKCYAKWATRVVNGILFHSVIYNSKGGSPTRASVNALGSKASHGCIRLRVADAKWIAENCPAGTKCRIYKSGKKDSALRKKLLKKSFSRDAQTYDEYMGRTADGGAQTPAKINLYKGKKGEQVTQVQNRLRALGFLNAAADGKFGKATKTAVNRFRAACGMSKTGKVNNALWDRLFADNAPTGTYATLVEGWQGPAVVVLQQALTDLKLFAGAVDGNFGADTREAVQNYQQTFNLTVDGAANTALQNEAISRAKDVKAQFGDAPYQLVASTTDVAMASVNVKKYTYLRRKASTRGKKVAKLKKNAVVKVLSDDGGAWVQAQFGKKNGYVRRKYLSFYIGTETLASYEAIPAPTPTPEIYIPEPTPTPEIYIPETTPEAALAAAPLEIEEESLPESAEELPTLEPTIEPTPEPTIEPTPEPTPEPTIEPTAEPTQVPAEEPAQAPTEGSAEEPVEAPAEEPVEAPAEEPTETPAEAPVEVPAQEPTETLAEETVQTPAGEPAQEPVDPSAAGPRYALAVSDSVKLYASASADALAVAELNSGAVLEVERLDGEWVAARYEERLGYVLAAEVALLDDAPVPADEPVLEPGSEPVPDVQAGSDPGDGNGLTIEEEQPE